MRIGGKEVVAPQTEFGSRQRYDGPSVGPTVDTQGLQALAGAVGAMGALGSSYLAMRVKEDEEREDFEVQQAWQKFQGDRARAQTAAQTGLGPQGAGFTKIVQEDFDKSYADFEQTVIPERLRPAYRVRAEGLKQESILRADSFTREATRGYSLFTVGEAAKQAEVDAYANPENLEIVANLEETIRTAPGLSAAEREEQLAEVRRRTGAARLTGVIRDGRVNAFAVPHSQDVQQRLIPAIIGVESGGNPNAESPKGASGLMQVMPSTGKDISVAIRDRNFPYNGTVAEQKAYLKDPHVSKTYGTYYLNMLLTKYGGDVELALIGYNAGSGVADRYVANGRNPAVLPEETRKYVPKVMARAGALTPGMAMDPQYGLDLSGVLAAESAIDSTLGASQNLAADILMRAEADAEKRVSLEMKAAKEAQDRSAQNLFMRAELGEPFEPAFWAAVERGELVYDQTTMNTGRAISERVLKTERDTVDAIRLANTGGVLNDAQGDLLIGPDIRQGILTQDPQGVGVALNNIAGIGFVPPATEQVFRQMLFSPNIQDVSGASQMLLELERRNPSLVANLPEDMLVRANSFEAMRKADMPEPQVQEMLALSGTVAGKQAIKAAKQNNPDYEDNRVVLPSDMSRVMDSVWARLPGIERSVPTSEPGMTALVQNLYTEVYDTYFAATLDPEKAKELALEQVAKTVGPTNTNGSNAVMWLPPEIALSGLRYDVNGDGRLETVNLSPEFIQQTFDRDLRSALILPHDWRYVMMATSETQNAARTGKPVPYTIIPIDANGTYQLPQVYRYDYKNVVEAQVPLLEQQGELQEELRRLQQEPWTPELQTQIEQLEIQIFDAERMLP